MPDIFASKDATATSVATGLADTNFATLFNKNANLGTVKYQSYSIASSGGTYGTPVLTANFTGATETTVLF